MIAVVNILDVNTITIENISATKIIPKGAFQLPVSKIILPFVNTSYVIYPIKAKLIIVKILAKVLESLTFLVVKEIGEHTSELQSRFDIVCRLLLEKKKKTRRIC